jgi:hypothetical protein
MRLSLRWWRGTARNNDIRKIYLVDRGEVENSGSEEGMIYFNNVLAESYVKLII